MIWPSVEKGLVIHISIQSGFRTVGLTVEFGFPAGKKDVSGSNLAGLTRSAKL